jgi:8-oxo-dGTP diphosphatase
MKKFNNVQNTCIKQDGKEYWISRSVGIVAIIVAIKNNEEYFLIGKRGKGLPDMVGYYNLICGYLDYNETGFQAMKREVYEEAGLDLDDIALNYKISYISYDDPYHIDTNPKSHKQNISIYYDFIFNIGDEQDFPKFNLENVDENEVEEVLWMNKKDLSKYNFAFSHDKIISECFILF